MFSTSLCYKIDLKYQSKSKKMTNTCICLFGEEDPSLIVKHWREKNRERRQNS